MKLGDDDVDSAPGNSILFRACRKFHSEPWFDFVSVLVDVGGNSYNFVARLLTFVCIEKREGSDEDDEMLALVEWYTSCNGKKKKSKKRKRGSRQEGAAAVLESDSREQSMETKHPLLPMPYVERCQLENRYDLVDTSAINGGLWVQRDFDEEGKFWVITCDAHDKEK